MTQGEDISVFFPYNRSNPILFRVNNIYSSKDVVGSILPELMDLRDENEIKKLGQATHDVNKSWLHLEGLVQKYEFQFKHAHYSEGLNAWWDIMLTADKWDEVRFNDVLRAISEYRHVVKPYTND